MAFGIKGAGIFAGGAAVAAVCSALSKTKGAHDLLVKGVAGCMRAGEAFSAGVQTMVDDANDLNVEARRQAKIDAAVKDRLAEMEEKVREEVVSKMDAQAPEDD